MVKSINVKNLSQVKEIVKKTQRSTVCMMRLAPSRTRRVSLA